MPADERDIQRVLTGFAPVWQRVTEAEPEKPKEHTPKPPKRRPNRRPPCCPLLPAAAVILAARLGCR